MNSLSVESITESIYSALFVDLEPIEYSSFSFENGERKFKEFRYRRPRIDEVEVYTFPQTWGSTALGFGGIGGSAMTTAYTVVVLRYPQACVYFGGRLAYKIAKPNQIFYEDLRNFNMSAQSNHLKYEDKQ